MLISSVTAPTAFPWQKLPTDLQYETIRHVPTQTLWSLRSTCKTMQQWADRLVPRLAVNCREGLAMLGSQQRFPSLKSVALVGENDMIHDLPTRIQHLDLQRYRAQISETTLQHMASLPLKSLNLKNCDLHGLSITHLLQGSSIREIGIGNGTPMTNDNYRALAQHPTLTKLAVHTNTLKHRDLDALSKSSTLIDLAIGEINTVQCALHRGFENNTVLQSLHITIRLPHKRPNYYMTSEVLEVSDAALSPLFRMQGKDLCLDECTAEALSNNRQIISLTIEHCVISDIARQTLTAGKHFRRFSIPDQASDEAHLESREQPTTIASSRKRARLVYISQMLIPEDSDKIPQFHPMHRSPRYHDASPS